MVRLGCRESAPNLASRRRGHIHTPGAADVRGDGPEIPDQACPRQQHQHVIGQIDLPPVETLTDRGRVVVVIVMPPFPERNQCQEEAIAAFVLCLVAFPADFVR
jgi:hypothetical protein